MEQNYWTQRRALNLTRRRLITGTAIGGAGVVAAAMVGCGDDDNDGGSTPTGNTPAGNTPGATTQPSATAAVVRRGGEFKIGKISNATFADPQRSSGGNDHVITRLYAEKLFRLDQGVLTPILANGYEQPDNQTVTIHMRDDMKFTDGTPVDAESVKYMVERGSDPEVNAYNRSTLALIKSVDVIDAKTARLNLGEPNALFLSAFPGASAMISPTAVERLGKDDFNRTPVGAGPYSIQTLVQDGESVFVRNPDWPLKGDDGGDLPYFDSVRVIIIPQAEALTAALLAGQVDFVNIIPLASVDRVNSSNGVTLMEVPATSWIGLEMVWSIEPTNNRPLRQAINYGINRDEVLQQLAFGHGTLGLDVLSPTSWIWDDSLPRYDYDLDRAKALLGQAGYPDGLSMKMVNFAAGYGEAFQAQLARLKIQTTIDQVEVAVYQQRFRTDAAYPLGPTGAATVDDELYQWYLARYTTGGRQNISTNVSPEWDARVAKITTLFDKEERKKHYQDMIRAEFDESRYAWAGNIPTFYGLREDIMGVGVQDVRTNADLSQAWKKS